MLFRESLFSPLFTALVIWGRKKVGLWKYACTSLWRTRSWRVKGWGFRMALLLSKNDQMGMCLLERSLLWNERQEKKMPTSLWIGSHLQMSNPDVIKQLALFLICVACHLEARSKTTGTVVTHLTFGRIMETFWILKSAMLATAKWPLLSPTRHTNTFST